MLFNRFGALAAGLAGLLAAAPGSAQTLPPTTIKVIGSSDQSNMHKTLEKPFWTERIPRLSNGAIKVEFSGLLSSGLRGPEIVRLMRTGAIDFAHGVFASVGADDATFEGMDLAGLTTDIKAARAVADAFKPVIDGVFRDKHGIKLLAMVPFTSQVFFCKPAVTGLADLKGKKVRVFGRSLADFVTAAGASTVTIPFGEVVPALQQGVADCAITGTASGNTAKWYEVSTYIYTLPVGWSTSFYAVGTEAWTKLDPAVRAFLEKNIGDLENEIWDLTAKEDQDGIDCNIGKDPCVYGVKGTMKLAPYTEKDAAERTRVMREVVIPNWAKRCGAACAKSWNDTVGKVVSLTAPTN